MPRKSETQALRQIRSLYALGPAGGLSDAQLVERFLTAEGADREDAFGALVQRHGPMVLRVCRRMLAGSAESSDDAFQAVFLVLARKAASVRQVEGLKSWLYGVAVRTAKEARRRSARRRAREGGAMDESKAAPSADEGTRELLALLDEEIDRLPARFREALMLCELEGVSRQEAARQLGVPEGTLSSRLSRGRSLLRSRLARRGVALGAGTLAALLPEPSGAAASEPLVETTVRLSLKFAAGGSVPPALASLAEGVLAMIAVARWKLALFAIATLGAAACLTAGLAWAVAPPAGEQPGAEKTPPAAVHPAIPQTESGRLLVHGVVVDEAGRPVEGAEVVLNAFQAEETRGSTGPDGSFTIENRAKRNESAWLLARAAGGRTLGSFRFPDDRKHVEAIASVRIVLKPAREVAVRVTDGDRNVLPGAAVEAFGESTTLAGATSDSGGIARLYLPADARLAGIFALKSGRGFDFATFGERDPDGHRPGAAPSEFPASVALTLPGARSARIKAVDGDNRPLRGVTFTPQSMDKTRDGELGDSIQLWSRVVQAVTGADGVATFDWLPADDQTQAFSTSLEGFTDRTVVLEAGATGTVVARLSRSETIRGKVVHADGSPARGIEVQASGSGQDDSSIGWGESRTGADGTYVLKVNPGESYAVYVQDEEWAAQSRLDVVVREGKPVANVDFVLTRGTLIRGTLTIGEEKQPVPGDRVVLLAFGGSAVPPELQQGEDDDRDWSDKPGYSLHPRTNSEGRFSVRVGPGSYCLAGPSPCDYPSNRFLAIRDQREVIRDFHLPRFEIGPLSGRVVLAEANETGVAGARVEVVPRLEFLTEQATLTADAQGRFSAMSAHERSVLRATNADGTLGAILEIDADDRDVTLALAPTANATGVLLDERGMPAADRELDWGRPVALGETENSASWRFFASKVVTDAQGRFTLPSLIVGQEYEISVARANTFGLVRPEAPGALDLGTLQIGTYRTTPRSLVDGREASSFRTGAPDAGSVAPPVEVPTLDDKPLSLDDFRGKYVLLDFWATWCGPSLGEIPRLQAVHDAFGKDGRFAILSLSVDEKIEEPRRFQEKRKLPWIQAFLGGGIQGQTTGRFGVRAVPAFVLVGPDGKIVARGMRGDDIKKEVAKALRPMP